MAVVMTSLDLLEEPFRRVVQGILAEAMERRVYFVVTETLRTYERQLELFREGKSRTMRSRHLIGKAVDVAPVVEYENGKVLKVTWERNFPAWQTLGELAEKYGVTWGGNWESFPDYPHLEAK